MKRILLIGMTSGVGGVETFITNIINNIDKNKFQVDVLLFQKVDSKYESSLKNASNVFQINAINKHPFKYFKDVICFYRKHVYDVVHVSECTAKLFAYCWPVVFQKKVKLIIHSHNGNGSRELLHKILAPIQNRAATQLWSCSNEATRWMFGDRVENQKGVKLIKNGIDVRKYQFSEKTRIKYRKHFGIPQNAFVIGSVARFEKQKNHKRILDIFKRYLKEYPNTVLVLVGDGTLKTKIVDYSRSMNIENKVLFLGNRDDITNILQMLDCILMPSLYEGLPFVSLEAQAAGLPIVASDTVDDECDITDTVSFVSLRDTDLVWVNVLRRIAQNDVDRSDHVSIFRAFDRHGYSLRYTILQIQKLYCD